MKPTLYTTRREGRRTASNEILFKQPRSEHVTSSEKSEPCMLPSSCKATSLGSVLKALKDESKIKLYINHQFLENKYYSSLTMQTRGIQIFLCREYYMKNRNLQKH